MSTLDHIAALRAAEDGQRRCRAAIDDLAARAREKRLELRDWDRKVSEAIDVLVGRAAASLFDAAAPVRESIAPEPTPDPPEPEAPEFLKAEGCDPRPVAVDLDAPIAKPGDIVRSSYGTGPYTVNSVDRRGSRGGRPTWTLTFQPRGGGEKGGGLINDLQRRTDGRIAAKNGDEVVVLPAGTEPGPTYWDWSRPAGDAATANAELQRRWMRGEPLSRTDKASPQP